jgi:hypothetical protein
MLASHINQTPACTVGTNKHSHPTPNCGAAAVNRYVYNHNHQDVSLMKKLTTISILLAFTFSFHAVAATVYKEGTVTSVKMFSDVVVIYVSSLSSACSTGQSRVAIKNYDPIFSAVLSAALTAKTTGAVVQIGYHQECNNNANSWDFESFWLK